MSKGATRYPIAEAAGWAVAAKLLVDRLSPVVAIAGSIRRERDDVGDIDLVVLEDPTNPWQHGAINRLLAGELGYEQTKDGKLIASFTHPTRCALDLYYATSTTWGITLLVRTGSAAHNIKLVERGRHLLPTRSLVVSRGIVDTAGNVVASATELDIFAALKLAYVEPADREAPEFESWIRTNL